MADSIQVIGIGGSLRAASTSRTALETALDGAHESGAQTTLIWVRELGLPPYSAEHPIPLEVVQFADTMYSCDAMIWSTPTYHGSISGSFKNALDWLILLAERDPPYLSDKPIGLVATAGGIQGLQAVNSMDFIARALRAWSVPLVQPVAQAWQSFGEDGQLNDQAVGAQLRALGAEVTRAARQFRFDGTSDYADARQFGGGRRQDQAATASAALAGE
ncbi:MAG: NADPH-dependent FMN reductase [Streptosporangiaceae bacterium]